MLMQNAEDLETDDTESSHIQQQMGTSEKLKNIHKIPSHPITIPSVQSSIQPSIKLNNNMEKIQYSLINNWIENGFIENMRGQVRCQLIKELKNPFKHQKNGGLQKLESTNHLSLNRRILNSIIIDYLSTFGYNYSLSIFKSEIGGELIGSLSLSDTYNQLKLNKSEDCILEQLTNENNANYKSSHYETNENEQELAMEQKRLDTLRKDLEFQIAAARKEAKFEFESALKEERCTVKKLQNELKLQMNLTQMSECDKFRTLRSELNDANQTINSLQNELKNADIIESKQWKIKYQDLNQELMNALNRENELQCLMDEERIKLKSAKREIKYLEELVTPNDETSNDSTLTASHIQQTNANPIEFAQNEAMTDNAESICSQKQCTQPSESTQRQNSADSDMQIDNTHNALLNKYEKLELDLKKRLKIQAMLETDTRKLTYHTKQFFNQLSQQKSQTTQIISKLHNSTPRFEQTFTSHVQSKENDCLIEINAEKKEQFEVQKKRNRQQYIYYNLDKLRHERNEIQSQMRVKSAPKSIPIRDKKEVDVAVEHKECDEDDNEMEIVAMDQDEEEENIDDVIEETERDIDEDDAIRADVVEQDEEVSEILDDCVKSEDVQSSLPAIDEHKEEQQSMIDWNEKERLERERIEQDLMEDYTQSESFSGIDCLQSDFLQQYQKHIENMNNN